MARKHSTWHVGRSSLWIVGFVCILTMAGWFLVADATTAGAFGVASSAETLPSGTIPPGTIPFPATVTFIHAAPTSASLPATAVDVCDENGALVNAKLAGVLYGETVSLTAPLGTYDWKVTVAGSNCATLVVDVPSFQLLYDTVQLVIVIGDDVNQPVDVIVTTPVVGTFRSYLPLVENVLPVAQ